MKRRKKRDVSEDEEREETRIEIRTGVCPAAAALRMMA